MYETDNSFKTLLEQLNSVKTQLTSAEKTNSGKDIVSAQTSVSNLKDSYLTQDKKRLANSY